MTKAKLRALLHRCHFGDATESQRELVHLEGLLLLGQALSSARVAVGVAGVKMSREQIQVLDHHIDAMLAICKNLSPSPQ